jgi:hypothetical protein
MKGICDIFSIILLRVKQYETFHNKCMDYDRLELYISDAISNGLSEKCDCEGCKNEHKN